MGVHFVALAVVLAELLFRRLGAAIVMCGLVGLAMAGTDADSAMIDLVSGVLPGAILLAVAFRGARGFDSTAPQQTEGLSVQVADEPGETRR